jgi:hypothetical protein
MKFTAGRADRLKYLNHQILKTYLELLELIVTDTPKVEHFDKAVEKTEYLRLLMIHFHHGLNEYRPHQVLMLNG